MFKSEKVGGTSRSGKPDMFTSNGSYWEYKLSRIKLIANDISEKGHVTWFLLLRKNKGASRSGRELSNWNVNINWLDDGSVQTKQYSVDVTEAKPIGETMKELPKFPNPPPRPQPLIR